MWNWKDSFFFESSVEVWRTGNSPRGELLTTCRWIYTITQSSWLNHRVSQFHHFDRVIKKFIISCSCCQTLWPATNMMSSHLKDFLTSLLVYRTVTATVLCCKNPCTFFLCFLPMPMSTSIRYLNISRVSGVNSKTDFWEKCQNTAADHIGKTFLHSTSVCLPTAEPRKLDRKWRGGEIGHYKSLGRYNAVLQKILQKSWQALHRYVWGWSFDEVMKRRFKSVAGECYRSAVVHGHLCAFRGIITNQDYTRAARDCPAKQDNQERIVC